jgi:hypothetical protein
MSTYKRGRARNHIERMLANPVQDSPLASHDPPEPRKSLPHAIRILNENPNPLPQLVLDKKSSQARSHRNPMILIAIHNNQRTGQLFPPLPNSQGVSSHLQGHPEGEQDPAYRMNAVTLLDPLGADALDGDRFEGAGQEWEGAGHCQEGVTAVEEVHLALGLG